MYEHCCGIPRELTTFWKVWKDCEDWPISAVLRSHFTRRVKFYKFRIHRVFSNVSNDDELAESMLCSIMILLGRNISQYPDAWIGAGLVVPDGSRKRFACPAALSAFKLFMIPRCIEKVKDFLISHQKLTFWQRLGFAFFSGLQQVAQSLELVSELLSTYQMLCARCYGQASNISIGT